MIDFNHLDQYRENNRIEAKKALGGLPKSLWETYSAFANTLGGIILLGVEELPDKSLRTVDLPDPQRLIREFWEIANNPQKTSVNILSGHNVTVEVVNGDHIIVITVPRAQRCDKPVYLEGNPLNTYRRSGEGDYHCTREEITAMARDASVQSPDMAILEHMDFSAFCADSIFRYRTRMQACRPGHTWETLGDEDFLYRIGAVNRAEDGRLHPTAAGLLMFGCEHEIVREFPQYFLDYREQPQKNAPCTFRLVSTSGDWSGNLFDFYFAVYDRVVQNIALPADCDRTDTPVHRALREALANCLINADYHGRQGLVITKTDRLISFSNPGEFRIDVETAKSGGISDPRNSLLIRMFNLVDVGERTGSGIPNIYRTWQKQGWKPPVIEESFAPERITLSLAVEPDGSKKLAICTPHPPLENHRTELLLAYLTDRITAAEDEAAKLLRISEEEAGALLHELEERGIVIHSDTPAGRLYRLKS